MPKSTQSATPFCSVESCDKSPVRGVLCYGHYMKQWRYGSVTPPRKQRWEDLSGQRFGLLTAISRDEDAWWLCRCDCGAEVKRRIGDLRRTKQNACGAVEHRIRDLVGYTMAHQRVRNAHGRASSHQCVDCHRPAEHWSYDHSDPDELFSIERGGLVPYSLDIARYAARCVACHKAFDLIQINGESMPE